ncbi:hypothetical protein BGX33_004401 [Mortierella sp. NVP41]|nr:hypothetical protein BGX33_004401 [Mortierella sp. NVP41]
MFPEDLAEILSLKPRYPLSGPFNTFVQPQEPKSTEDKEMVTVRQQTLVFSVMSFSLELEDHHTLATSTMLLKELENQGAFSSTDFLKLFETGLCHYNPTTSGCGKHGLDSQQGSDTTNKREKSTITNRGSASSSIIIANIADRSSPSDREAEMEEDEIFDQGTDRPIASRSTTITTMTSTAILAIENAAVKIPSAILTTTITTAADSSRSSTNMTTTNTNNIKVIHWRHRKHNRFESLVTLKDQGQPTWLLVKNFSDPHDLDKIKRYKQDKIADFIVRDTKREYKCKTIATIMCGLFAIIISAYTKLLPKDLHLTRDYSNIRPRFAFTSPFSSLVALNKPFPAADVEDSEDKKIRALYTFLVDKYPDMVCPPPLAEQEALVLPNVFSSPTQDTDSVASMEMQVSWHRKNLIQLRSKRNARRPPPIDSVAEDDRQKRLKTTLGSIATLKTAGPKDDDGDEVFDCGVVARLLSIPSSIPSVPKTSTALRISGKALFTTTIASITTTGVGINITGNSITRINNFKPFISLKDNKAGPTWMLLSEIHHPRDLDFIGQYNLDQGTDLKIKGPGKGKGKTKVYKTIGLELSTSTSISVSVPQDCRD